MVDSSVRVSGRYKQDCPAKLQISFPKHEELPILTHRAPRRGKDAYGKQHFPLTAVYFLQRQLN